MVVPQSLLLQHFLAALRIPWVRTLICAAELLFCYTEAASAATDTFPTALFESLLAPLKTEDKPEQYQPFHEGIVVIAVS